MKYTNEYNKSTYEECSEEEKQMLNRVDKLCRQKHIKWKYCSGTNNIFIYTTISTWMTTLESDVYVLYHNNRTQIPKANFEYNFHKQEYEFDSLEEAIKYIARHDHKKYKRDQKRLQESSIERAFRKIKSQQG